MKTITIEMFGPVGPKIGTTGPEMFGPVCPFFVFGFVHDPRGSHTVPSCMQPAGLEISIVVVLGPDSAEPGLLLLLCRAPVFGHSKQSVWAGWIGPEIGRNRGLGGSGKAKAHPKRWGAKRPTYLGGLWHYRSHLDPHFGRFPAPTSQPKLIV